MKKDNEIIIIREVIHGTGNLWRQSHLNGWACVNKPISLQKRYKWSSNDAHNVLFRTLCGKDAWGQRRSARAGISKANKLIMHERSFLECDGTQQIILNNTSLSPRFKCGSTLTRDTQGPRKNADEERSMRSAGNAGLFFRGIGRIPYDLPV